MSEGPSTIVDEQKKNTTTTATAITTNTELEQMKKRIKEMEEEAKKLEEMQRKQSTEYPPLQMATDENDTTNTATTATTNTTSQSHQTPKQTPQEIAEIDSRSIYVGNVDWSSTPEELQAHFQACGIIKRITIASDKRTGVAKGFAYIEFSDASHITNAMALNESLFRNRLLKVIPKRTNTPGYGFSSSGRGNSRGGARGSFRGGARGGPRGGSLGGRSTNFSPY